MISSIRSAGNAGVKGDAAEGSPAFLCGRRLGRRRTSAGLSQGTAERCHSCTRREDADHDNAYAVVHDFFILEGFT